MIKLTKKERQKIILSVLANEEISTQEELVEKLHKKNLKITQATVSRDIKDLNITKINTGENTQKYIVSTNSDEIGTNKLINVFVQALISYDSASNLVVIKTLPGMAPASASAIDSLDFEEVVGSIAGDDTIFIATKSSTFASKLVNRILKIVEDNNK